MVLMRYFCFVIPVRLGVIITSALIAFENVALLILTLMYNSQDIIDFAGTVDVKDSSYESMELYEKFLDIIKLYAIECWYTAVATCAICLVACILNILSAATKKRLLSSPFILVRFFEIVIYFTFHVNCMLYMKKIWNLGILIAACCAGGFLILLLLYFWGVTVAMYQMIGVVNSKHYQDMINRSKQDVMVLKKPKNQEIATISTKLDGNSEWKMITSDFHGVYKSRIKRI